MESEFLKKGWFRWATVVVLWITSGLLYYVDEGYTMSNVAPTIFFALIPATTALAGLVALFFSHHYDKHQRLEDTADHRKYNNLFELRQQFRRLIRDLLIIAAACIVALFLMDIIAKEEAVLTLVTISIAVFAIFSFYDTYRFIWNTTIFHVHKEL